MWGCDDDVDDLERGVDFYGSLFGLQVGRRLGGYAVELLGGPAPIYLLQKNAGSAATPDGSAATPDGSQQRHYGRHWTPVHLDFVVDDIESVTAKAIAQGARLEQPITTESWGSLALLADPFSHGFCLIQVSRSRL